MKTWNASICNEGKTRKYRKEVHVVHQIQKAVAVKGIISFTTMMNLIKTLTKKLHIGLLFLYKFNTK